MANIKKHAFRVTAQRRMDNLGIALDRLAAMGNRQNWTDATDEDYKVIRSWLDSRVATVLEELSSTQSYRIEDKIEWDCDVTEEDDEVNIISESIYDKII